MVNSIAKGQRRLCLRRSFREKSEKIEAIRLLVDVGVAVGCAQPQHQRGSPRDLLTTKNHLFSRRQKDQWKGRLEAQRLFTCGYKQIWKLSTIPLLPQDFQPPLLDKGNKREEQGVSQGLIGPHC